MCEERLITIGSQLKILTIDKKFLVRDFTSNKSKRVSHCSNLNNRVETLSLIEWRRIQAK